MADFLCDFFNITGWRTVDSPDCAALVCPLCGKPQRGRGEFIFISLSFLMPSIMELCRELRQRETPAEKVLWHHLRNRKLFDHKFLRQHPVCAQSSFGRNLYYIPDFYCHQAKLVIEADGPIHLLKKDYDKNRDEVLRSLNLTILRFENAEILSNTQEVLDKIKEYL